MLFSSCICFLCLSFLLIISFFASSYSGTQRQSKQLLAEHFQGLEDEEEEEEDDAQPDGEEEGQGGGASEDDLHDEEDDDDDDDQNDADQQDQKVCDVM